MPYVVLKRFLCLVINFSSGEKVISYVYDYIAAYSANKDINEVNERAMSCKGRKFPLVLHKPVNEPRCGKTCFLCFRPGPTQIGLFSHRRWKDLNFRI